MVLTPIRRLFDKKKTPWDNMEHDVPELDPAPNSKEALHFVTTDKGETIIFEADITNIKVKNVEVQWDWGKIYVTGEIIENGTANAFKSKFKMPKGAKRNKIEGHLLRDEGKFFIKVPISSGYISPRQEKALLRSEEGEDEEYVTENW
jgi:HSP20 family molecular chaperone IbpA